MPSPISTGAIVEARGERWLLTTVAPHGGCTVLTLEGRDRDNAKQRLSVIEPFERSKSAVARLTRRPRRAVLRAALATITNSRSAGTLWTVADAAMDVWPYQLEPALAAINGATRLLLADAVGLGKTIQAGLLLSELRERGWIERALIVCPAGLRETWARELEARFSIAATVLDHASIAERIASLPAGMNPWSGHRISIASIDFIKRPEVLAAIEAEPVDLLIADEAHHVTPGTDRGHAIARLAHRATWCVLMSATPHSGDASAFDYLTRIGEHGDALATFRRSRSDVGLNSSRRSQLLAVRPTVCEAALFDGIGRYVQAMQGERGRDDQSIQLIGVILRRRAASSATAILRTLTRRHELLGATLPEPIQPLLPWDEEDEADDVEADAILATPALQSVEAERTVIVELIDLARRCANGSKLRRLSRFLHRVGEPVVVFTEYRDTLRAILAHLGSSRRMAAIHGGMAPALRQSVVDAFNDGDLDTLIATDAAGEGLNLHHRSRIVIDMELPWNPLRLEQRVGRVDRLGQQRTVHAIRLFHPGTIEEEVLERLTLRGHRAAAAFEPHPATPQAIAEASRIERQRYARQLGAHAADGAVWCRPRRARRQSRWLLVGRHIIVNELGGVVGETSELIAALLSPACADRLWRERITGAWARAKVSTEPSPMRDHTRATIDRRVRRIREHVARVRIEHQGSLFDRRDDAARVARDQAASRVSDALTRTQAALRPQEHGRLELVAAWPESTR